MFTVAIIGCGATGVSLLAQLVELVQVVEHDALQVLVFEKSDFIGPGLAYSCHPDLMMNSPAGIVTVIDKDNHHFLRWLAASRSKWESSYPSLAHIKEFDPEWFCPRALVGIYLHDMFEQYRRTAEEKGIMVRVLKEEVVNIEEDNGTTISTDNGHTYEVDSIVIATGNICASPNYAHLSSVPSFYPSQYVNIDYAALRGKRVLVLGTSLGGVDAALLLHSADPHAQVVLASKRGRLPAIKSELTEYTYEKLTPAQVDAVRTEKGYFGVKDIDAMVKSELTHEYAGAQSYADVASSNFFNLPSPDDAVALFEREMEILQEGGALWQRFQFGWINIADYLWKSMESEVDKRKFQRYYTTNIHRFTSSFHVDIALKVRSWLRNGTMRLASLPDPATLAHRADAGEFSAQLSFRGGPLEETHFDAVIDASGVSKRFAESAPLFENLHKKNYARFNPYGGLDVHEDTLRVHDSEHLSARVYAAGSPTYGSFFYTNFILVGARHAGVIAREIQLGFQSKR